ALSPTLETESPSRPWGDAPHRALARHCACVPGGFDPGRHPHGPHRTAGSLLGRLWPVCLLPGERDIDPDVITQAATVHGGLSLDGACWRYCLARRDLDFRRGPSHSIFPVLLLRARRRSLSLGPLGDFEHGCSRGRLVVDGESHHSARLATRFVASACINRVTH